jgi:hypothetical protein
VTTNANLTGVVTSSGNATSVADKALAIAKLADGTDGELITWDASGVIAAVAAGSADEVLTSNGAGAAPTFQAATGGEAAIRGGYSSMFETAGRFYTTTGGSGAVTFDNDEGVRLDTTTTTDSFGTLYFRDGYNENYLEHNVSVTTFARQGSVGGTNGEFSIGFGRLTISAASITMTGDHFHYHLKKVSGTITEQWSQADGSTETVTNVTGVGGLAAGERGRDKFLYMKQTGSTNVKYYLDGALDATLTGNLMDTDTNEGMFWAGVTNREVAEQTQFRIRFFQVEVDVA